MAKSNSYQSTPASSGPQLWLGGTCQHHSTGAWPERHPPIWVVDNQPEHRRWLYFEWRDDHPLWSKCKAQYITRQSASTPTVTILSGATITLCDSNVRLNISLNERKVANRTWLFVEDPVFLKLCPSKGTSSRMESHLTIQEPWCNMGWISRNHNTNYIWCYDLLLIFKRGHRKRHW